jgi:hypothetical protein
MGPLSSIITLPDWINLAIAFLIGTGFGFSLEQAGFSSSRKLVGMFYGYDTTVIKVFFTAAIVALTGSQLLSYLGLLNLNQVYVNEFYVTSSVAGGIIMGAGFVMGGFCPGTGLCAMAIGKIDAVVFVAGGLAGAFLFAETFPSLQKLANSDYRGPLKLDQALGIPTGISILLIIAAAVIMFWISERAEMRFAKPAITKEL